MKTTIDVHALRAHKAAGKNFASFRGPGAQP